jgi:hypothetical protein
MWVKTSKHALTTSPHSTAAILAPRTASQTIRSAAKENQKSVGSLYNAKATYSTMVSRLSAQTFSQKSVYLMLMLAPVTSVERQAFCHGPN